MIIKNSQLSTVRTILDRRGREETERKAIEMTLHNQAPNKERGLFDPSCLKYSSRITVEETASG